MSTFLLATGAILFWKIVWIAFEEMRFRNNRD